MIELVHFLLSFSHLNQHSSSFISSWFFHLTPFGEDKDLGEIWIKEEYEAQHDDDDNYDDYDGDANYYGYYGDADVLPLW